MTKKVVLCLMVAMFIVIIVALPAEMIIPDQIQVNCRIKSVIFPDVTWLGCVEGLFVYYQAGDQTWRLSNHNKLSVINNITDIYEEIGTYSNSVDVYLFNGQIKQMVTIDEGGIFYTSSQETISLREWLINKKEQ